MIIGGDPEATQFFHDAVHACLPRHHPRMLRPESELAKYAANLYWATRVTFVNEFA